MCGTISWLRPVARQPAEIPRICQLRSSAVKWRIDGFPPVSLHVLNKQDIIIIFYYFN